jgi:hypothetical protein
MLSDVDKGLNLPFQGTRVINTAHKRFLSDLDRTQNLKAQERGTWNAGQKEREQGEKTKK